MRRTGAIVISACAALAGCGGRTSLHAGDRGSTSTSTTASTTTSTGTGGASAAPACHPGDPVETLYAYPPSGCATVLFGVDATDVYVPTGDGVLRVPKGGGAGENLLPGYALSTHVNALGVFAVMLAPGCSSAPCGDLVHVIGGGASVDMAPSIGSVFLLEPWPSGGESVVLAHTYPDPLGQISRATVDAAGLSVVAHYVAGVVRPTLDGRDLFVPDAQTNGLLHVDVETGAVSPVAGASDVYSTPAVVGGSVYFTDASGHLARVPKGGGAQEIVASGFDTLAGRTAVAARGEEVFFNELPETPGPNSGTDGRIVAVDVSTGAVRTLAAAPDVGPVSFITADDACVYWSEARWADEGGGSCASASIKRAPR